MNELSANQNSLSQTPATWSAELACEDIVAQIEDALAGPISQSELLEVLRFQGLSHELASSLLAEIGPRPPEAGEPQDTQVELVSTRMWLRANAAEHSERFIEALVDRGLSKQMAQSLLSELLKLNAKQDALVQRRRRMLGVQGSAVGAVATGLLVYGGLYGGQSARWHLVTAVFSGALMLYSLVLWRRNL